MIIELSIVQTWGKSVGEWHPVRIEKNTDKGGYIYKCHIKLGVIFFRIIEVVDRKKLMISHAGDCIISVLKDNSFREVLLGKKPLV